MCLDWSWQYGMAWLFRTLRDCECFQNGIAGIYHHPTIWSGFDAHWDHDYDSLSSYEKFKKLSISISKMVENYQSHHHQDLTVEIPTYFERNT
jgi:hypothetical protein